MWRLGSRKQSRKHTVDIFLLPYSVSLSNTLGAVVCCECRAYWGFSRALGFLWIGKRILTLPQSDAHQISYMDAMARIVCNLGLQHNCQTH